MRKGDPKAAFKIVFTSYFYEDQVFDVYLAVSLSTRDA